MVGGSCGYGEQLMLANVLLLELKYFWFLIGSSHTFLVETLQEYDHNFF